MLMRLLFRHLRIPVSIKNEFSTARTFSSRNPSANVYDENELRTAREWLTNLNAGSVPRHICQVSFSRSSGPGGQNVNKLADTLPSTESFSFFRYFLWAFANELAMSRVNSKATLKVPLASLLPLVPPIVHSQLRSSRYVAQKSQALVIQSDDSRKQASNVELCYEKLSQLLEACAKNSIPGETSQQQTERVRNLYDNAPIIYMHTRFV